MNANRVVHIAHVCLLLVGSPWCPQCAGVAVHSDAFVSIIWVAATARANDSETTAALRAKLQQSFRDVEIGVPGATRCQTLLSEVVTALTTAFKAHTPPVDTSLLQRSRAYTLPPSPLGGEAAGGVTLARVGAYIVPHQQHALVHQQLPVRMYAALCEAVLETGRLAMVSTSSGMLSVPGNMYLLRYTYRVLCNTNLTVIPHLLPRIMTTTCNRCNTRACT